MPYRETFTNLLDEYLEYKKLFEENPDARLSNYDSDRYRDVINELNERCSVTTAKTFRTDNE